MGAVDVRAVSDYFLSEMAQSGESLSNLKLQKMLYYAQGWFLAINGRPLFDNEIQAWVHGPVVVDEYHRFKEAGYAPIIWDGREVDLPEDVAQFLDRVIYTYGSESAYGLEVRTHREAPWVLARGDIHEGEPSNAVITVESMAEYFGGKLSAQTERQSREIN